MDFGREREELVKIVLLNNAATLRITHAILKRRRPRKPFTIVFVSSLASMFPMPLKATYAASKRFLLDLATSLRQELKSKGVNVLTLCPGGMVTTQETMCSIKTQGFWGNATTNPLEGVSRNTIDRALAGKSIYVPGILNRVLSFFGKIIPRSWVAAVVYWRWKKYRTRLSALLGDWNLYKKIFIRKKQTVKSLDFDDVSSITNLFEEGEEVKLMTISEVTKVFNVSTRMLRYYDEIGLLPSTRKEDYSYRVYDEPAVRRLQQIITLRKLRIPLKKIASIFNDPDQLKILETFQESISELDEEITALHTIRDILNAFVKKLNNAAHMHVKFDMFDDAEIMSVIQTLSLTKIN